MAPLAHSLVMFVAGWVLAGAGVYAGYEVIRRGFELRRQRELVLDTPTEDAGSVSMGPSELFGAVRAVDEPLVAPFTDEPCVVALWRVEEYRKDGSDDAGSWDTVASGVEHVPFFLDDGTGRIRVEVHDDVTFDVDDEPRIDVDVGENPPARVGAFLAEQDVRVTPDQFSLLDGLSFGTREGDRRYHQQLLQPGEQVYVFGTVQPDDDAPGGAVVRAVADDSRAEPLFLVGDRPAAEIAAARRRALWRLPAGAGLSTAGVLGLAYMAWWTLSGVLSLLGI